MSAVTAVPFLDLSTAFKSLEAEWLDTIRASGAKGSFILGPQSVEFEKEFAQYVGVKHAIGVANGTDSLILSLRALGIGPGDEVITTPWTFFASALGASSRSVVASSQVVSKVYFPRLIIPVAAATAFLIDLLLSFTFLVVISPFWGIYPTWRFILIPFLAVFALMTALCFGVWLAALNVRYRDIIYTVPFLIQALMFASPIGYSSSLIPANLRALYGLNPLAGLIEGFRWASTDVNTHPGSIVAVSFAVTIVLLISGLVYFGRSESSFADII